MSPTTPTGRCLGEGGSDGGLPVELVRPSRSGGRLEQVAQRSVAHVRKEDQCGPGTLGTLVVDLEEIHHAQQRCASFAHADSIEVDATAVGTSGIDDTVGDGSIPSLCWSRRSRSFSPR